MLLIVATLLMMFLFLIILATRKKTESDDAHVCRLLGWFSCVGVFGTLYCIRAYKYIPISLPNLLVLGLWGALYLILMFLLQFLVRKMCMLVAGHQENVLKASLAAAVLVVLASLATWNIVSVARLPGKSAVQRVEPTAVMQTYHQPTATTR